MEPPLTELRNQRLPRRKMAQTYGKKKAGGFSTEHRNLFGSDDNQLEAGIANLSIQTSKMHSEKAKSPRISKGLGKINITPQIPARVKPSLVLEADTATIEPLLQLSGSSVEPFSSFGDKLAKSFDIEKIGEGSFAEVFKLTSKIESHATAPSTSQTPLSSGAIIKVIPLDTPSVDPNIIDRLSSIESVAREIRVFRTLDSVHGFTRFRGVRLVTGVWPKSFLDAFHSFRKLHKKRAVNAAPDDEFSEKQIYALVEMDDAGSEIALLKRPSVFQVYDILWMMVVLLANAEEQVELEHRDLHLSNICVKPLCRPEQEGSDKEEGGARIQNQELLDIDHSILANMSKDDIPSIKLGSSNMKITIIDYTVTRCLLTPVHQSADQTSEPQEIAYDNMLFLSGPNDASEAPNTEDNIQYAAYRKAKAAVEHAQRKIDMKAEKWSQFVPQTNIFWLSYLLKSLSRRAKGRSKKYYVVKGSSRIAKQLQEEMWDVLSTVEDVVSGVDTSIEDDSGDEAVAEKEEGEVISVEEMERTPGSARELLALAVEKGWLAKEEIEAFKERLERE